MTTANHQHRPYGDGRDKTRTAVYASWAKMRWRCENKNADNYPRYGGRGIVVCDRWKLFANFLADMGDRPPGTTLERGDNDGNYEPGNCRWASRKDQARNRSTNHLIEHAGETLALAEWAERAGIDRRTMCARLRRGWSMDRIMATPTNIKFRAKVRVNPRPRKRPS